MVNVGLKTPDQSRSRLIEFDFVDKDEEVLPNELNLATRLESLYSDLQHEATSFVTWYGPLCSRE